MAITRSEPYPGAHHRVRAGNTVYFAGQASMDEEGNFVGKSDPAAQAHQVLRNLERRVQAEGGTLAHVVKVTTYLTDRAYYGAARDAREEFFGGRHARQHHRGGIRLRDTRDILIEVDAVAVLD